MNEFVQGTISQDGEPDHLRTFILKNESGIKFLVKFNEVSRNLETPVENALNTAEKIRTRFPQAKINVEIDVKIL